MDISPASLQAVGLSIDVVGALVIAAPDIPIIRDRLFSGKLSQGLSSLKAGTLTPQDTGFEQIKREVEDFADAELPEGTNRLYIGHETLVAGGRSPWVVYADYGLEDDSERAEFLDGEFKDLEEHLRNEIDRYESKFRGFGFVTLSIGFITQIIAIAFL